MREMLGNDSSVPCRIFVQTLNHIYDSVLLSLFFFNVLEHLKNIQTYEEDCLVYGIWH